MEPNLGPPFRPLRLLGNAHLQTVLGTFWPGPVPPLASRQLVFTLPDGDRLLILESAPPQWRAGQWTAILVHGLGGSYASGGMCRLAAGLVANGVRVLRVNLRGAGGSWQLARQMYCAGCSADVRAVADYLARDAPGSPLVLIGFSLGGNIVLKLAGEAVTQPLPGLAGVAAMSAPIDLTRCSELLAQPANRIYERFYLRKLVYQAEQHQAHFRDLPKITFPKNLTLRQFDDVHTAARWGFASAEEYYRLSSALPLLPDVKVPVFLLTARDDPFIATGPYETLPTRAGQQIEIVDRGGHLGFLGDDGAGGIRWAERRLLDWVVRLRP